MGLLKSEHLTGVEETLAARITGVARSIAPGLDSLEGDAYEQAILILRGIAKEAQGRGSRLVKGQRIATASVEYFDASWFSVDDRAALRALCSAASTTAGTPVGSFPKAGLLTGVWPEETEKY